MLRVVADTNIYISVFAFGGPITEIFELAQEGGFELHVSPPILAEIRRVLAVKLHWPKQPWDALLANILEFACLVNPKERLSVITADPDDDRILECALEAAAAFIVTGDKRLLILKDFRGIQIVTPREFLEAQAPRKN